MPLWQPGPGPQRWLICWKWGLPPCSAGGGSSPVLGTDWIAVKTATAWCLTVLATRSASGSCSPATSRNSRHCCRGRSCQSWPIGGCISAQSAASTGCSMPTAKCIRRGRARPPQQPRTVPRLEARGPNDVLRRLGRRVRATT